MLHFTSTFATVKSLIYAGDFSNTMLFHNSPVFFISRGFDTISKFNFKGNKLKFLVVEIFFRYIFPNQILIFYVPLQMIYGIMYMFLFFQQNLL